MLQQKIKYTLLALTVWGVSGCSQKTIVLQQEDIKVQQPQRTQIIVKRPTINEEILIKKNPNLGNRVDVPTNNPSLGASVGGHDAPLSHFEDENLTEEPILNNNGIMDRIAFPIGEYNRLHKRGRSTVTGLVYLVNNYTGQKVMGEKVKLWLNPVTSYSQQWYEESYLGGYKMSKNDSRLFNYMKYTMSNGSGKFSFFGVAPGNYYLVGTVNCASECGFGSKTATLLVEKVSVGRGVKKIDLMKSVPND